MLKFRKIFPKSCVARIHLDIYFIFNIDLLRLFFFFFSFTPLTPSKGKVLPETFQKPFIFSWHNLKESFSLKNCLHSSNRISIRKINHRRSSGSLISNVSHFFPFDAFFFTPPFPSLSPCATTATTINNKGIKLFLWLPLFL